MRKKVTLATAAIAVLGALALIAPGVGGAAASTTVTVGDDFFSPQKKSVGKGTKVKFRWTGNNSHNVTKQSGPGGGFASPTTSSEGVNFTKKFKKAGTYKLICTIHPDTMRMKLKVG